MRFNTWTVNDKLWPNIDPLMVKAGKRYRIVFHSGHEDGHPLHLHRHSFELVKAGNKTTGGNYERCGESASRRHGGSGIRGG